MMGDNEGSGDVVVSSSKSTDHGKYDKMIKKPRNIVKMEIDSSKNECDDNVAVVSRGGVVQSKLHSRKTKRARKEMREGYTETMQQEADTAIMAPMAPGKISGSLKLEETR